jgi:hypothetical protein
LSELLSVLADYVFQAIFFPIGWPLMKILTLGKYPAKGSWFSESPSAQWTSAIGLAVLIIAMMAAMKQFVLA